MGSPPPLAVPAPAGTGAASGGSAGPAADAAMRRCDAATSTDDDDLKGRPLSLFYFTHPFGVLSAEPPARLAAPAHAATFLDMRPVSPWRWAAGATLDSSSLFSSELWFSSSCSSRGARVLPPLRLPSARTRVRARGDAWPRRAPPPPPERFSLPPIELPAARGSGESDAVGASGAGARDHAPRRRLGVAKPRRRRRCDDVRRVLARLMRRAVKGAESSPSPALQRVLSTIRDAWAEPRSLRDRCGARRAMPPPAASPGLLRRRYSVPETVMRKYRLEQQRSESEESGAAARQSASPTRRSACRSAGESPTRRSACRSAGESPLRFARRDRELMRKSALLRRAGALPARCRCADSRSLDGSRAELHRAPWAEPKRLRLDAAELSDSTFCSHRVGRGPFTDSCASESRASPSSSAPATAEPESERPGAPLDYSDSDPISVSTARETTGSPGARGSSPACRIEGLVGEWPDAGDECAPPAVRPLPTEAPHYELLEIVVSETLDCTTDSRGGTVSAAGSALTLDRSDRDVNIDEYVSHILVESLNSLTDQLECMNASIGGARRISIVEKEIKVKLQNTGVNTIVHLSPTSNNQIIFGNEELCDERTRDDPLLVSTAPLTEPSPPPPPPDPSHRAVLQQIQKLFLAEGANDVSRLETTDAATAVTVRGDRDVIGGVATGNYFRDGEGASAVPRFSAYPHTVSMEVNTSSSSDAMRSDCASLVDSLDDPASPRRSAALARSAVDVLELLPEGARSAEPRGEAFFVRIEDDGSARDREDVRVAEYMPERIKQRLHRRHRKREQRMESARRSKVKQLKKELERRRLEDAARARREAERGAAVLADALVAEVVAELARAECARLARAGGRGGPETGGGDGNDRTKIGRTRRSAGKENLKTERPQIRGKLLARPALAPARPPRRVYQKSEIHEGEKCIEILEILEYADGSPSSPETTTSDENPGRAVERKKSRIPVPVGERGPGSARRASPPAADRLLAGMLLQALARAPPAEPRARSNSLRFKRVFDAIPEERGAGAESPPRRLRSQTTMTSPRSRSAATSPLRAAPPPAPAAGGKEGAAEAGRGAGPRRGARGARSSSSGSGDSGGSLLCSLAPRWLAPRPRRRACARRSAPAAAPVARVAPEAGHAPGGWSVTVAGSCRAALPHDVEMRLRFPHEGSEQAERTERAERSACGCVRCAACAGRAALPPAAPDSRLALTLKKEAQDSTILATKSLRKQSEPLPELETYRASRTKLKSSLKTRRGYSLHCWLPAAGERAPLRASDELSVLGCAIVPELKPRAPTMSERDLTRVYSPRHYLRS